MVDVIWEYRDAINYVLLAVAAVVGLWRGATPERLIILSLLAMLVLDRAFHGIVGEAATRTQIEWAHLGIDAACAASLIVIAVHANRLYSIWMAGIQLVALITHGLATLNPSLGSGTFLLLMIAPSYVLVLIYGVGLLLHLRRQRRFGPYPSWQSFSGRSRDRAQKM